MTDAPFFEPWPDPDEDDREDSPELDLPWMPPAHVAGVVLPVAVDAFRGEDLLMRVTHVVAYERGLELHVGTWLRPGTRRPETGEAPFWHVQEPRVGVRLADGTRLGHWPPHGPPPPEADGTRMYFAQLSGNGGGLHSTSSWWVHPLPEGDSLEVVVEWQHQGVPESSAALDLGALRAAAARQDVLWDAPPGPQEGYFGWSAPFPVGAHGSSLAISFDESAESGDEDD
jgi:hypothetical protein